MWLWLDADDLHSAREGRMSNCVMCRGQLPNDGRVCHTHMAAAMREKAAVIADLKARLKAVRRQLLPVREESANALAKAKAATDLRRKNWRKP